MTKARLPLVGALVLGLAFPAVVSDPATAAPTPEVSSLSSRTLPERGGARVTITGSGFTRGAAVDVGGRPATQVTVVSTSRIEITTPALAPGNVALSVSTSAGQSRVHRGAMVGVSPDSGVKNRRGLVKRLTRASNASPIVDPALRTCVNDALGLPIDAIPSPQQLTSLLELNCQQRDVVDLTGLEAATGLVALDLSRNSVTDLTPLSMLPGLRKLWLPDNNISDLTPLSRMRLIELDVAGNLVETLAPLSSITALQQLNVSDNRLTTLAPLSGLVSLIVLAAEFNSISDLAPLRPLTRLVELQLWDNKVVTLSPLAGLVRLDALDLSWNQVTNLSPLSGLLALRTLALESNSITSVAPLRPLTALGSINLNNNQVSDVSPLSGMTGLYWLFLNNNRITDLAPLKSLTPNAIEARDQVIALPPAIAGWWPMQLRDSRGGAVPVSGATVAYGSLRWPGSGSQRATWATADTTFTGTITQSMTPQKVERMGDAGGDGIADLYTITGAQLSYWQGSTTTLATSRPMTGNWSTTTLLSPLPDMNGDRVSDLLSRDSAGTLWAHPVLGPTQLAPARRMGQNWNGMTLLTPVGHLTGGKEQYIVARRSDGLLFRYTITSTGLTGVKQIGRGWGGMRQVLGAGDVNRDGRDDLLAIRSDGTLWFYAGTAVGGVQEGRQVGHGWTGFTAAFSPGDLTGDGIPDLVGVRLDGNGYRYQNLVGRWGPAVPITSGWAGTRLQA